MKSQEAGVSATATGLGRQGQVVSSDGRLKTELSVPRALGGDDGRGTNPEQLFASGYAACFHSALKSCGRLRKVELGDSSVTVEVTLSRDDRSDYRLSARIWISVPKLEKRLVEELVEAAHALCPYSNATRGNIEVELAVK
jgi:osmotically inducible protein OsmC